MSLNSFLSSAKGVFVGGRGIKPVWRVAAALIACGIWNILSRALFTWLFALLFDAWGVNTLNLRLAPAWVRAVVNGYPYAISVLVNLPAALVFTKLSHAMGAFRVKPACAAFFALGACAVIIPAALFVFADSMRLVSAAPRLHWPVAANLPVCIIAAWAEQALTRGYVLSVMRQSHGVPLSCAVSVAVFLAITAPWGLGALGFINMLLMAVMLCALTMRFGSWSAAALRAGWSWAANSLIGFSGVENSVFSVYPVSETLITGGEGGLINGIFTTVILILGIWLLVRRKINIKFPCPHKKSEPRA